MDSDKASLVTRVRSAQIKLLYENAALSTLMSLINAALVFFLLREFMPKQFLLIWLAAIIIISLIRIGIYRLYWSQHGQRENPARWQRLYLIGAYASGALWGLMIYVAGVQDILWLQGFMGFITAGMTAGGLSAMAPILSACIPYAVLVTGAFIAAMLYYSDHLHLVMSAMAVMYLLFLIRTSIHLNRAQLQSIKAQFEGDDLYGFLQHSRADTKQLDRSLPTEIQDYDQLRNEHENFFEYTVDPQCIIGPDSYFELANPALEKLTGFSIGNLQSRPLIEWVHPDDRGQINTVFKAVNRGMRAIQFRCRLRNSDDQWIPLLWHVAIRNKRLYASLRPLKNTSKS